MESSWSQTTAPDGRVYFYNTQTKATQWTKPVELMTPAERALAHQPWKEYVVDGGQGKGAKKYWYNSETKQSTWEMPEVYKNALAQTGPPQRPLPQNHTFVAGGVDNSNHFQPQREREEYGHQDRMGHDRHTGYDRTENFRPAPAGVQSEPEYATFEDAEAAFLKLLRRSGVQPEWTWEQTMRTVVKDPQYRALKDPKDRKAAFEKYAVEVRMQEKDRAKERLAKLRADFGTMLRSHPEIKHYTRWKTARAILEGETIFRSTGDITERRQLFDEYIVELKKAHQENEVVTRKSAMDELVTLLKDLDLEPYTRWAEAQGIIQSNDTFKSDHKFKSLSKSDILTVFENHIKSLERSFNEKLQRDKNIKIRRQRQNRDAFSDLLKELRNSGKIKAGTKWMEIQPVIETDPRYVAMLGQPGSTPLDMFWDMVEDEERALRGKRNEVLDILDDKRYEMSAKTTLEDFMSVMDSDARTASMSPDDLSLIYTRLHEKILKRAEEDKHHAERHQRRAVDALRSRIKHLDPPLIARDTWEVVKPRLENFEEFAAVEDEEARRAAFEKVVKRLREKEEDAEKERSRRDNRARENDHAHRDARYGHPSRRHARSSRTPEPDAYEADRKKAQADRERQYRKAGATGLSPPPPTISQYRREKMRDGNDGRYDRERDRSRHVGMTHYDRERREREVERERSYISRADPRERGTSLDYGESRAGSMRRRRDSDAESAGARDNKRTRRAGASRERTVSPRLRRSITPAQPPVPKEEPSGVHSGSEEGEIEED